MKFEGDRLQTLSLFFTHSKYEGESVNKTQLDIKRKTGDIRAWEKHSFLDKSSTSIDTLVPSLYQCVETRRIDVFLPLSQPLPHLRFNLSSSAKNLPSCFF
jgi:hypothetical protein